MPVNKSIKLVFWNAQSITNINKRIQLEHFIKTQNLDIVLLAETFLKPIHDFNLRDYVVHRNDRIHRAHGGVAIIIRKTIAHKLRSPINTKHIENISIDITVNKSPICITSAYSPQYSKHFSSDITALCTQADQYMIFGDFNARHTSWNCFSNNKAGSILYGIQQRYPLLVHHTAEHTHFPHSGQTPSTIDLLLSNSNIAFNLSTHANQMPSDHMPVYCYIRARLETQNIKIYDYHRADWRKYRHFIDNNIGPLPNIATCADIDSQIERFSHILLRARGLCVPEKTFNTRFELSTKTKHMIQIKNSIKRRWQRTILEPAKTILKNELNYTQKQINKMVVEEHNAFWSMQLRNIPKGHKRLWNLTKQIKGKLTLKLIKS